MLAPTFVDMCSADQAAEKRKGAWPATKWKPNATSYFAEGPNRVEKPRPHSIPAGHSFLPSSLSEYASAQSMRWKSTRQGPANIIGTCWDYAIVNRSTRCCTVGIAIINHPPCITISMGGINHEKLVVYDIAMPTLCRLNKGCKWMQGICCAV